MAVKKILAAIAITLTVGSVGVIAVNRHLKQLIVTDLKAAVTEGFYDPKSTQFRNVKLHDGRGYHTMCGEVNAKNAFGAYTGFRPFSVSDIANIPFFDKPMDTCQKDLVIYEE